MLKKINNKKEDYIQNLRYDLPAGLVVFLVAVPLSLGIALASGAPFFSGIIAGVIGGLVVPFISKSQVSVSGPAAGLTTIVLLSIQQIGSFEGFLVALFIAGFIQVLLGIIRSGIIAYYIPSAVIKGMLAAIGLLLILKQLPHAIGYDIEIFEDDKFLVNAQENTFTLLLHAFNSIEWGAFILSVFSLAILLFWEIPFLKKMRWIPGALIVVVVGVLFNQMYAQYFPHLKLNASHLVNLPIINDLQGFLKGFNTPDWSYITHEEIWITALTIGLIASIETLLTLEALEKIDPYRRKAPLNQELIAQGIGNSLSGLVGGLPITSVIVRSSVGLNAGGRTKMFVIIHGLLLLVCVVFISQTLNQIPLACLAAILLIVGYKLASPSVFIKMYKKGWEQFLPFTLTIVAILLTDLLIGVGIGIGVGLFFVIRTNFHSAIAITKANDDKQVLIRFNKDVSFLNKPLLTQSLQEIEPNSYVIIDAKRAHFIDYDILELLHEFKQEARHKNIQIEMKNFREKSQPSLPQPTQMLEEVGVEH
ncbi:MAG: SulP family inorganic anion transporter [Microscillaceae bacterium]|nr:SulP family inorganic anion transporter [Microscillaceae bacterium]